MAEQHHVTTASGTAPLVALLLGWAGVIPFLAAAGGWILGSPVIRIYALQLGTAYAATIIVFLGAVHWGVSLKRERASTFGYIWSVLPSLAVTLVLAAPPLTRPIFLLTGLLICWGVDAFAWKSQGLPQWYLKLRHGLTACAAASMAILSFA